MPSISTLGSISARAFGFAGAQQPIVYRGSSFRANSTGSTSYTIVFSGVHAQAGDLGIVCYFTPAGLSNATAMSGWTKLTYQWTNSGLNYVTQIYYKTLSAADISTGATITGMSAAINQDSLIWGAYGNATVAALVGNNDLNTAGTTLTVSAAVSGGAGYVSLSSVQWSTADVQSVTAGGFTLRTQGATAATFSNQALADLTTVNTYGGSVTWTQTVSGLPRGAAVLKLT